MASDEALALLRSIDASLKLLVAQKRAEQPKAIASDRDLDGQYGNPQVKFMPRDWTGPTFKGRRMSECPPELLDLLAETFDYFARKAEETDERTDKDKPVADFKRADAARARGWAKRIRDGRVPAAAGVSGSMADGNPWGNTEEGGWA
jgi:hypothetical protein